MIERIHVETKFRKWVVTISAGIGALATLYTAGSWINYQHLDSSFINKAEAEESYQTIMARIRESDRQSNIKDVELRLELISLEIDWVLSLDERNEYHDERLNVLRTQQRILLERYDQLQQGNE